MRRRGWWRRAALGAGVATAAACGGRTSAAVERPSLPAAAAAAPTPPPDRVTAERDRLVRELRAQIAGRETLPASEVFKNVQTMKTVPAGRLLAIMNVGYGKSLGVSCSHCHVVGQWEKEDKPTKQIAREMSAMDRAINEQYLRNIKNLKSETPVVNCTTCHRGQVKPALDMTAR